MNSKTAKPDITFDEFLNLPQIALSEFDYLEALRSNINKITIYIKRSLSNIHINPFNETILALHRANMDIQFILDPYACIAYIVDYINKSDRGMSRLLKQASEEANQGNFSNKKKLRHIANKFSNATEISAQECVYFILGMQMSQSSNEVEFINTSRPEDRDRYTKSDDELKEIQKIDPNSKDKFKEGAIEHYMQRPQDDIFSDMCLADFVAWYTFQTKVGPGTIALQNSSGFLKKRTASRIIRYRNFSLSINPQEYFREQIMLYFPWRCENELLALEFETFYKANQQLICENRSKYSAFSSDEEFAELMNDQSREELNENDEVHDEFRVYDALTEPADIYNASDANETVRPSKQSAPSSGINIPAEFPENDFLELISSLNEEQRHYLTHFLHNIKNDTKFYEYIVPENHN